MGDEQSTEAMLTEAVRVAVRALAEHIRADTPHPATAPHPVPDAGADAVTAALNGVEVAARVREHVAGCLARIADEVCEAGVDEAIMAARAVRPQGASWARIGARLGVTGQAVSKRAGVRRLSREKATPDEAERAELARHRHHRWLSTLTHTPAAPPPREPAVSAPAVVRDDALSPARIAAELAHYVTEMEADTGGLFAPPTRRTAQAHAKAKPAKRAKRARKR